MSHTHILSARRNDLREGNPIYRVDFEIWHVETDSRVLHGLVCWQGGLDIYTSEGIEPGHWPEIAAEITKVLKEAREMIGDGWCCTEPV
jgi:hypothetical protein